ncbi:MAG: hypothetical protein F9K18_04550 [Thermoanaerobaculia bacterium]|nr:MAG: hypothetical protein F9K18_04550 [Thermoanaerobaculia bacterium]
MTRDLVEDVESLGAGDDVAGERGRPGESASPDDVSRRGSTTATPNRAANAAAEAISRGNVGTQHTDSPSAERASPPTMQRRRPAYRLGKPPKPPTGPVPPHHWRLLFALSHFSGPVSSPDLAAWIETHIHPSAVRDSESLAAAVRGGLDGLIARDYVEVNRRTWPHTFRLKADPLALFREAVLERVLPAWVITPEHARLFGELAFEYMRGLAATQHDAELEHQRRPAPPIDDNEDTKA